MPPRKKVKVHGKGGNTAKQGSSKRADAVARPIRGRRGGLKDMPTMPLDVLLEIFKYMHPRDLLYLARTTKEFREFLMRRTSAPYWRETLKNVPDVPPCPSFLCEPAYVNLLFTTNCLGCGKSHSGTQWVIWELFVRYCSNCRHLRICNRRQAEYEAETLHKSSLEDEKEEDNNEDHEDSDSDSEDSEDSEDSDDDSEDDCKDDDDDDDDDDDVLDITMVNAQITRAKHSQACLLEVLKKNLREWSVIRNTDEAPEFLKELKKRKSDVARAAKACSAWAERQLVAKEDVIRAKREGRIAAIMKRLREEGWGDEMKHLMSNHATDFRRLEIVRRTTELTEEGWTKVWSALESEFRNARRRVDVLKENKKMDARFANLGAAITEFNKSDAGASLGAWPGYYDYIVMPKIMELAGAPLNRTITKDDFLALMPALSAKWLAECKSVLEGLVREKYPSIDAAIDPMSLFAALFRCNSGDYHCRRATDMRFPAVLEHRCLQRSNAVKPGSKTLLDRHLARTARGYLPAPLLNNLARKVHMSPYPLGVLAALEKDPACTTVADLQDNNTILECAQCTPKEDCVFTWKSAMRHFHNDDAIPWVTLLNEKGENVKKQRSAEAKAAAKANAGSKAATKVNAEAGAAAAS